MAPSRRQKATVHTDLKADRGDSSSDIMWDHAAGTQRAWLVKLQKSLSGIATHKTYASGNYCTSRGKTAVFSVEHAMAIDDVSINAGGHSIEKPMTLGTYKRTATVMTDVLKDRFVIAPQVLEDEAANFLTDILDTMEDDGCAAEYKISCNGDPLTLLGLLMDECDDIPTTVSEKADDDLSNLIRAGLASADVPSFNALKTKADTLNKTIRLTERHSDAIMAGKFIKVVNSMGRELRRELKDQMRHTKAEGNLALTVKAIRHVLGEFDVLDDEGDTRGNALAAAGAREPRNNRRPGHDARKAPATGGGATKDAKNDRPKGMTHANRPWAAADGNCRHCKKPGHWNDDCRDKPDASAKVASGAEADATVGHGRVAAIKTAAAPSGDTITARTSIANAEDMIAKMFQANASASVNVAADASSAHLQPNSDDEDDDDDEKPPELCSAADEDDSDSSDSTEAESDEAAAHGQARVAAAKTPTRAAAPAAPTPPPLATAPASLSYKEVRSAVASLSPEMNLKDIKPVIAHLDPPVSPGVGGSSRRTKTMIVDEARAAVNLPPLTPPMGIAVPPPAAPVPPPPPAAEPPPQPSAPSPPPAAPAAASRPCGLEGCDRPCFVDATGRVHDYCDKTHAALAAARSADYYTTTAPAPPTAPVAAAVGLVLEPAPPPPRFTAKCCLIGLSIAANLLVVLVAVAAAGIAYGSRTAGVIAPSSIVFDDMGERLSLTIAAAAITPIALIGLLAVIGLPGSILFSTAAVHRLMPRWGRVCPLIPPSGRSHHSPRVTIHTHRRQAAAGLMRENLREYGPLWLTLFFLVEWCVSAALDAAYHPLGLALHPHSLPRQASLSDRWRIGACRRCVTDTADVIHRSVAATLSCARVANALHACGCATAAHHAWSLLRRARRRLGDVAWAAIAVADIAWLEVEGWAHHWLALNTLRSAAVSAASATRCISRNARRAARRTNPGGLVSRLGRRIRSRIRLPPRPPYSSWATVKPAYDGSLAWGGGHTESAAPEPAAAAEAPVSTGTTPAVVGHAKKGGGRLQKQLHAQAKAYDRVRARASISAAKKSRAAPTWRTVIGAVCLSIIVDSGCTWHSHPDAEDLINLRPCDERIACADGVEHACSGIGDLPLITKDERGKEHTVLLRDVRCVPTFTDTLVSIEQLWSSSNIDVIFRNRKCLVQVADDGTEIVALPFKWYEGLYHWDVGAVARASLRERPAQPPRRAPRALKGNDSTGVHGSHATSHLSALSPNEVAKVLHRRLHISLEHLRRLTTFAADAPASLAKAHHLECDACAEANSTRLPHSGASYQPTYAGRLVHADIVGPFKNSTDGGYKWILVLVDDHSRFKFLYFMKQKSEAPKLVRRFIAKFNAMASTHGSSPTRVVGALHTDNAGEFLSRSFQEMLDENLVTQTTCPPHVHALNGVAERAIRSVMDMVRVELLSSGLSTSFWTYAANHAVDVLNRTTGPPGSSRSSYEMVTGERPRVLPIMPLGCRAYVVKPDSFMAKTNIPTRAWRGVNLGRSVLSPGAYLVWVKSTGRVHVTSDVYFAERRFPLRPKGSRHVGPDLPTPPPPDASQPPGVPLLAAAAAPASPSAPPSAAAPQTLSEAYEQGTRGRPATARASRRVLLLFSGPYERPDGLAVFLRQSGFEVSLVDSDPKRGGGERDDLTNDAFYNSLLKRAMAGEFLAIIAAPPCSTFSISRFIPHPSSPDGQGPPVLRRKRHPEGVPDVPSQHLRELRRANRLVRRMAYILGAACAAGSEVIVENPPYRGDPAQDHLFMHADHSALWQMPIIQQLRSSVKGKTVTFAQCMFGAEWQKYTTFLYSPGFEQQLAPLHELLCSHPAGTHTAAAGGHRAPDGVWNSSDTAAFPADLNLFLAQCVRGLVTDEALARAPDEAAMPQPDAAPRPSAAPPVDPAGAPITVAPTPPAAADAAPPPEVAAATPRSTRTRRPYGPRAQEEAPRGGRIPTRGAIRRGEVADPFADSLDFATDALPGAPSPTVADGVGLTYVAVGGSRSFVAIDSLGRATLASPSAADPKSRTQAHKLDRVGWLAAEAKELASHLANASWTLIDRSAMPAGRRLVRLIWVYKVKRSGALKARLCVQGCTQVAGVDYDQTFCATMRSGSLRLLCALAARHELDMRRWDFVSAYLQGELLEDEVVYCSMPPGYEMIGADGRQRVCRVEKPIYGMAQAGRRWQRSIFPWLIAHGFKQMQSDTCVFYRTKTVDTPSGPRVERLLVGCYVDDLFVLKSHDDEHSMYHEFVTALQLDWEVEDEGPIADLLGIEITREDEHVVLRQTAYIAKLVETYCPDGVPAKMQRNTTPCVDDLSDMVLAALAQRLAGQEPDPEVLKAFQSLVGALLYCATNTRPDITFSVSMLCRAMSCPTPELLAAAQHVLHYLHRHRDVGLRYALDRAPVYGMSDSDWAVKHSTSGMVFMLNHATVSWGTKKQVSVALSSCEAEIMAASEAAKEAVYLNSFLDELGEATADPVALHVDNMGARDLAYNPEHHQKTKHIERRHFYIRELVENLQVTVPYVATDDNIADFFTKGLKANKFFAMRDKIMNVPASASVALRASRRAALPRGG